MFNIFEVETTILLRGARAVMAEARTTIGWARRVLESIGGFFLRLVGPQLTAFKALLRESTRAVSRFASVTRKLEKGQLADRSTFAELAVRLASLLGRLVNLADRLAAFVETRFLSVLETAQKILSAAAMRISRIARNAMKRARAVFDRLTRGDGAGWPAELKAAVAKAVAEADPALSAIRFFERVREGAQHVLAQIDPDEVARAPAAFAAATLDRIFDAARAFRELVRVDRFIRALRAAARLAERSGADELRRVALQLLDELEALYSEAMGTTAEAMKHRVSASGEGRRLQARLARARPEEAEQARLLKMLAG